MPPKDNRNQEVTKSLAFTLELIVNRKPNDRTALDRIYAVTKNDIEHAYAYFIVGITALAELEAMEEERNKKNARKD